MPTLIPGATASTYVLTDTDIGEDIFCRVTGTNSVGASSANSNTVGPVEAATAFDSWDPANHSAGMALSNSDHTATATGTHEQVRGLTSRSTGKRYFEITWDNLVYGATSIGLTDATHALTSALFRPGVEDNAGFSMRANAQGAAQTGTVTYDLAVGGAFAEGSTIGVLVDLDNHRAWFYRNGVLDRGDPTLGGSGDPFAWGASGPAMYPWAYAQGTGAPNNEAVTINSTGPFMLATLPTGYTAWGA